MDIDHTSSAPLRYCVRVLGCKVNQYEACQIEHVLQRAGFLPAEDGACADVAVVHACGVTNLAMRKSRQILRRLRADHPGALLIMSGCGAALPGFDAAKERCLAMAPGEHLPAEIDAAVRRHFSLPEQNTNAAPIRLDHFTGHKRAFLKIQDGCSIGCTYCIVPRLRGAPRDTPFEAIVSEAENLVKHGYSEFVVSGVSVGLYGIRGGPTLAEVLRALLDIPGVRRLRMSSLHPQEASSELLELWASTPRMMPHVHFPLQSGSNRTLAAMRRGYTAELFLDAIRRFRAALDQPAFTTDIITGFPGETEEDFAATHAVCEEAGFAAMHVFPYSDRPGTPASRMPNKVPPEVARERAQRLEKQSAVWAERYYQSLIGRREEVLVEQHTDGYCTGHGERYFPITFPGGPEYIRRIVPVRLIGLSDSSAALIGEICG